MSSAPHYRNVAPVCATCPYWQMGAEEDNRGECRASPPNAVVIGMEPGIRPQPLAITIHPSTGYDHWCGKHPGREILEWKHGEGFLRTPTLEEAMSYKADDEVKA